MLLMIYNDLVIYSDLYMGDLIKSVGFSLQCNI